MKTKYTFQTTLNCKDFFDILKAKQNMNGSYLDYYIVDGAICDRLKSCNEILDTITFEKDIFEFKNIFFSEIAEINEEVVPLAEDKVASQYTMRYKNGDGDTKELIVVYKKGSKESLVYSSEEFNSDTLCKAINKELVFYINDAWTALGIDTSKIKFEKGVSKVLQYASGGRLSDVLESISRSTDNDSQHYPAFLIRNDDKDKIYFGVVSDTGDLTHINTNDITEYISDETYKLLHTMKNKFHEERKRAERQIGKLV